MFSLACARLLLPVCLLHFLASFALTRQLPSMSGTANLDGMAPNGVTKPIISSGSMAAQQHVQIFTNIEKSKIDTRQYRGVRLSNGLRILLISDPKTDKSSAALDVNVGSLSDPIKLQGLSHFLEHMLFLGTEKYPSPDDYSEFLSQHAGYNNAYTSATHTNYYFDVDPNFLESTLDRFAQFFIAPLFNAVYTDKELNAVHSEYEQYLDSDRRSSFFVDKETCDPTHDYHKFTIGNRQTLKEQPKLENIDVRQELLNFHSKWYSANLMSLAVLGKESLDELYEMVVGRLPFGQIPAKNITPIVYTRNPYQKEDLRKELHIVPIKDIRELSITFPIPDYHQKSYKLQPSDYLSHLIGHEGEGSLLSLYKDLGWVNSLSTYGQRIAPGIAFFGIKMELTDSGIDQIDPIISKVFQYINMLKDQGVQRWIFDECQRIKVIKFDFKEKEKPRDYVSTIASNMHDFPIEEVIRNYYIFENYSPDMIKDLLGYLDPNNMRFVVISKKFEGKTNRKEKYFDISYSYEDIPESKLEAWTNAGINEKLHLPPPNNFIPENLELVPREPINKEPKVIKRNEFLRVWYMQDDEYKLPKAFYGFHIKSPISSFDPLTASCLSLYIDLLKDALNEYSYSASLAGIDYTIDRSYNGIILKFAGYSDKLDVIFDKVTERLLDFRFSRARFETMKEAYFRQLKNFSGQNLYKILNYYYLLLSAERTWTIEDSLATADQVTFEAVEKIANQFFSNIFIEALIHGNVNQDKAEQLVDRMKDHLISRYNSRPAHPSFLLPKRHLKFENDSFYILNEKSQLHQNNAIFNYFQFDMQSTELNVKIDLLNNIFSEKFYNVLRTEEQLGYVVYMYVKRYLGVQGLCFFIQSSYKPDYLDTRIENFVHLAQTQLAQLTDEDFNVYKESLRVLRCELPKKLINKSEELWSEIHSGQYNFNRREIELNALKQIAKQDIVNLFDAYVMASRRKLSIRVVGESKPKKEQSDSPAKTAVATFEKKLSKQPVYIKNITAFQNRLEAFPIISPFISLE